jgi:O-antigen/teichoic acid export membrane protein
MRFKEISLISLIVMLSTSAASVGMALFGLGVWSLILSGFVGVALNMWLLSRSTPLRLRLAFDRKIAQGHGTYGFKALANELVDYLRDQASNLIISRNAGPASVGIYNKAQSLGKMPLSMFSIPVYQTVFRAMSAVQDNQDKTKYMFLRMISLLALYTLPFYVGVWWLAKPLIVFVYGQKWSASAAPLEIIALAGLIFCVGHPCGAVLAAQNRLGRELIAQTIGLLIVVIGSYVGLRWGLSGVAVAFLFAHLYTTAHMYWLVKQCVRVTATEVFQSLRPALILNTSLVIVLVALSAALPSELAQAHPGTYSLACAAFGSIAYGVGFLFLPLPAIASESLRWKRMLRLAS